MASSRPEVSAASRHERTPARICDAYSLECPVQHVLARATLKLVEDVDALVRDLVTFLETPPDMRGDTDALRARVKLAIGEGQEGARVSLARSLANALAGRAATLLKDLRWLETFDDQFDVRGGTRRLPLDVLAIWFCQAAPNERAELLASLDARTPWSLVAVALAEADAEIGDVVALCAAHAARSEQQSNAIADGISRWAERRPQVALTFLDQWRQQQLPMIRPPVLESLVRALANAGVLEPDARTSVVQKLIGSFWQEAREAGLGIECFAWPPTSSLEDRHNAVLSHVSASPRLGVEALRVLARDAWRFPKEALASARAVLATIDGDVGLAPVASELAPEVASVLVAALSDEKREVDLTGSELLLELLVMHPLGTGKLDHVLASWHERDAATARRVLQTILKVRAREVVREARPFGDHFPLVSMRLGNARRQAWLLEVTQSEDLRLRGVAWSLLANDPSPLTAELLTGVPDDAVERTATDVAAHSTLGAKRMTVLVLLGAAHPTALARLLPVAKEVALEYPGATREALVEWKAAGTDAARSESPLAVAASEIETALAARQAAFEDALSIPEVTTIAPTRAEWLRAENQATERAMKEARARSVFASFVSSVPIVRGRTTSFMGGPPTPMQEFSSSVETSREEALDPIGAFEKRLAKLARSFPEAGSKT